MSASGFEDVGDGHFRVTGGLGFDTVPALWRQSLEALGDAAEPVIDLGQVAQVDSAGLALVLEWVHWARRHGRRLKLIQVPDKLLALARISETDGFLNPDASGS